MAKKTKPTGNARARRALAETLLTEAGQMRVQAWIEGIGSLRAPVYYREGGKANGKVRKMSGVQAREFWKARKR